MPREIIDEAYKQGGAAFHKGKTLRQLIEPLFKEPDPKEDWSVRENKNNSMMLGYADAFISFMRSR